MDNVDDLRPLPGGPISIDLLNTRWGPPGGAVDWLTTDEAVRCFAAGYGVDIEPDRVDAARAELVRARDLIARLFGAEGGGSVNASLAAETNSILAQADARLSVAADGPGIVVTSDDPTHRLAVEATVDAIDLLGLRPDRLRSCQHDDCTLWFLDTSKGGRRRWCSMERCGNRAKAKRHYARSTAADEPN